MPENNPLLSWDEVLAVIMDMRWCSILVIEFEDLFGDELTIEAIAASKSAKGSGQ